MRSNLPVVTCEREGSDCSMSSLRASSATVVYALSLRPASSVSTGMNAPMSAPPPS